MEPTTIKFYAALTSNVDCASAGGMGTPATKVGVQSAGNVAVVNHWDGSEQNITLLAGDEIEGAFSEVALGNKGQYDSSAGSYPASSLGGKTMVIRLDEGTAFDTENVTVTFDDADTTQASIIARINAALQAQTERPSEAFAADEGSDVTSISSHCRGTAGKAEVVSIHADVATATGFSTGSDTGDATGAASNIRVMW